MVTLTIICLVALNLLVWFRTDAWLEYTRLFRLNFLSYYKDYDAKQNEDATLTYIQYLRMYHNCFAVRLITCPTCFAIWWGLGFGILTCIGMAPIYTIGGLIVFLTIDRLLG